MGRRTPPGRFARRQARARYWEFIRRAWWQLGLILVLVYGAAFALHGLSPQIFGDVFFGAMLIVPLWIVSLVVVSDPLAARWARGADGEQFTASELRKRLPRGYRVIHDVQLDYGNADHIVVGRAGVFVVETKWRSEDWATDPGYQVIAGACRQARSTARRIERLLADRGFDIAATPVVVLWGGNVRRWSSESSVRVVERITVVAGPRLSQWVSTLTADALTDASQAAAVAALTEHGRDAARPA